MNSSNLQRFLVVTGKGGVGKTTFCAAEALRRAQAGQRVLVAMCNAKESLSAMLGSGSIGDQVVRVSNNIWAVNMDPESALEEYGAMVLHSRGLYKLLFDNRYVRTFFRAVPGLQEWSMLGKAWWHTTEKLTNGDWKYDVVILDAPATGHGLDMLRVPKVIVDAVPPGILRRDAERAWTMMRDREACSVVLVTIPEEMPTSETIELAEMLTGELGIPVGRVVANAVLPKLFSSREREALQAVDGAESAADGDNLGEKALRAAADRASRERMQAESLSRLTQHLPIKPIYLPFLFESAANPASIAILADVLRIGVVDFV